MSSALRAHCTGPRSGASAEKKQNHLAATAWRKALTALATRTRRRAAYLASTERVQSPHGAAKILAGTEVARMPFVPLMMAISFLFAARGAAGQCCGGAWMKGLVAHLFAAQPRISGEWPELVRDVEADMIAFLEYDRCSAFTAAHRWKTGGR